VIQKRVRGLSLSYKDVLIYRNGYRLTEIDRRFIEEIEKAKDEAIQTLEG